MCVSAVQGFGLYEVFKKTGGTFSHATTRESRVGYSALHAVTQLVGTQFFSEQLFGVKFSHLHNSHAALDVSRIKSHFDPGKI